MKPPGARAALVPLAIVASLACGPKPTTIKPTVYSNPNDECADAQQHIIQLAIKATGGGPTADQRQRFIRRCAKTDGRGVRCVMRVRRVGATMARVSCGTKTVCPKDKDTCVEKACFERRKVALLGAIWRCLKR